MKCLRCGYVVPDDSEFCPYCGARIEVVSSVTIEQQTAQTEIASVADAGSNAITQAQRYFDSDFGYSAENPLVVSSVQMEGYILTSLRTENGQAFTWQRQPRQAGTDVDAYQLYLNGQQWKVLYLRAGGNDGDHLPKGLTRNADAFKAAQHGITLEEFIARREAEQQKVETKKKKRKKALKATLLACLLVALAIVGYYGYINGYPYLRYQSAIKRIESAPQKSVETFTDLGDYRDSVRLTRWAHYYRMKELFNQGEYEAVLDEYDFVRSTNSGNMLTEMVIDDKTWDSQKAKADVASMVKNSRVSLAKSYMEAKQYDEAVVQLSQIVDSDKNDLLSECYYNLFMETYEEKDWKSAYDNMNKVIRVGTAGGRFDLSEYREEVLFNYTEDCLKTNTTSSINIALGTAQLLVGEFGETEQNLNLQNRVKSANMQLKYEDAVKNKQKGNYPEAVRTFSDLGDYKDSAEQRIDAMYEYVHSRLAPDRSGALSIMLDPYFTYAKELSELNFKDSKQFYTDLTAWHVYTIMNNDPDDDTNQLYSVSKYDDCCVHIIVTGGEPRGSVRLRYVFTMSNGNTVSGKWDWNMYYGSTAAAWCYYEQPQYAPTGTCKVRIYNVDTGKLMAEDSIRITG